MYTEQSVNQLIQAVEKEFTAHLAKAEEDASSKLAKSEGESASVDGSTKLAKAEDEKSEKPEHKEEKEAPKSEEKPAESKEAPKAAEAPAKEEGKEEAPAADGKEAAPAQPSEGQDEGHGYDDEDLAHMDSMYSSMSSGELKAHHDAVKRCLDGKMGEAAAPAAPAAAAPAAPMHKSETVEVKTEEKPAVEVELLKSESAAKDAQIADLKKNLDVATEFLNKLFTKKSAPAAKAITSVETIAKSEGGKEEKDLSKGEITAILNKKVADPSLTKSDRDLINAFYLNSGSINSISHLLK